MKSETITDLGDIDRKLNILTHLLAYQIVEGKTLAEGAPILKRLGFKASEIATVFGSTVNTVNVQLTVAKKRKGKAQGGLRHGRPPTSPSTTTEIA